MVGRGLACNFLKYFGQAKGGLVNSTLRQLNMGMIISSVILKQLNLYLDPNIKIKLFPLKYILTKTPLKV